MNDPVSITLQHTAPPPRRILVVDDDDEIRRLNSEVLIHHGYHVDTAVDGAIAWESLKAGAYDLLVTDHAMPKISGIELLQKLHVAHMALPVIMITGFYPSHEFSRRPWLQTAAILLKPYTVADLLDVVERVLRTASSSSERMALPPDQAHEPSSNRLRR